MLAEIVRLDRAHYRTLAGDNAWLSTSRSRCGPHQSMIWMRQRATNTLRSLLRECYSAALAAFADDLAGRNALAVLATAPDPAAEPGSPQLGWRR